MQPGAVFLGNDNALKKFSCRVSGGGPASLEAGKLESYLKVIKFQTPSTKIQINPKYQSSMSKTFPSIAAQRFVNPGLKVKMPFFS
jgi:hypothetical protein